MGLQDVLTPGSRDSAPSTFGTQSNLLGRGGRRKRKTTNATEDSSSSSTTTTSSTTNTSNDNNVKRRRRRAGQVVEIQIVTKPGNQGNSSKKKASNTKKMKTNKSKKKNSTGKKKSTKKKTSRNSTTKKSSTTSSTESDSSDSSDSSSDEEMQDSSDDENVDTDGASLYDSILHRVKWTRIILDEAHKIKSRTNNTAKSVMALRGRFKWCLSGTPLQNRISELYSLVRFLRMTPFSYYFCKDKKCNCSSLRWNMGSIDGEVNSKGNEKRKCLTCGHAPMKHYSYFNKTVLNPIKRYGSVGDGRKAFLTLK